MPHYLMSVCYPADAVRPDDERLARIFADVDALHRQMRDAGVWVFSGGLHDPSSATVVVDRDGDPLLTDGPFIEAKEQVGGLTILELPDLDAALEWGRRMSHAIGVPIEVRPFEHAWA
ncbi:MAG: hypothetical protein GC157_12170 [Frankiales bacterium]|nr:hypothetical protein [Frankiales bacterium]